MSETLLLTIPEVARHLRLSTRSVQRLIASTTLPAFRVGRALRIRRYDLQRFVDGGTGELDNRACTGPGVRTERNTYAIPSPR